MGLFLVVVAAPRVHTQSAQPLRIVASARALGAGASAAGALADLRAWDAQVTARASAGELRRVSLEPDTLVPGRTHERFLQYYQGVRVFGGDLVRQLNSFGRAESIFGTYYPDIAIGTTAAVTATDALGRLSAAGHGVIDPRHPPELVVLPGAGGYRLTWTARVRVADRATRDNGLIRRIFIDAASGQVVESYNDTHTQTPAVGMGLGVLGDRKKVSAERVSGQFLAIDGLRPSVATFLGGGADITFDFKGNEARFNSILFPAQSDIASDSDNTWTDPGIVDAHAYAGYVYDFYFRRFGRHGLDNHNIQIWSLTNPVRPQDYVTLFDKDSELFVNAAYLGDGVIYYGVGLPASVTLGGQTWFNLAGALDVVAHELTHGVTEFTSNFIYQNESGALDEAFSDIMGASVEFFYQPVGPGIGQADWLIGEDVVRTGGLRSMADPHTFGDPDHYSLLVKGPEDNGGVHTNSGIVNQMFYLAVAGGTNRVSHLGVAGVGLGHIDQVDKVIYRAFTQMLPANATFSVARAATIQAARDLYGAGSAVEAAITQAWTAVGVS